MTQAAPSLILTDLHARFRLAHDPLGWRINIGDDHYVRPDDRGRISHWAHAEGADPQAARRDVDLIRALIKATFAPHERAFRGAHSATREAALEAIVDAANEITQAGEAHLWIGADQ